MSGNAQTAQATPIRNFERSCAQFEQDQFNSLLVSIDEAQSVGVMLRPSCFSAISAGARLL